MWARLLRVAIYPSEPSRYSVLAFEMTVQGREAAYFTMAVRRTDRSTTRVAIKSNEDMCGSRPSGV